MTGNFVCGSFMDNKSSERNVVEIVFKTDEKTEKRGGYMRRWTKGVV
jgi:hypothetical protein